MLRRLPARVLRAQPVQRLRSGTASARERRPPCRPARRGCAAGCAPARSGRRVLQSPVHVGLARADRAAEGDLAVEARIVHVHASPSARSARARGRSVSTLPPSISVELAVLRGRPGARARRAARRPVAEVRLRRDVPAAARQAVDVSWLAHRGIARGRASTGACRAGWAWNGTRFSHRRSACQWIAAITCSGHERKAQQHARQRARR